MDDTMLDELRKDVQSIATRYGESCVKFERTPDDELARKARGSSTLAQEPTYNALIMMAAVERGADKTSLREAVSAIFSEMGHDEPKVEKKQLHPAALKRANEALRGL